MSECMIFYGPTVPEINYYILYNYIIIYIQKPGQTTLIILRTSVATTQPKGHRQPGRSSEENDQHDQWNIEGEATFTGNETTEK